MPTLSGAFGPAQAAPRRQPSAVQRVEQSARSREEQLRAALDLIGVQPTQVEHRADVGMPLMTQATFEVSTTQLNNALIRIGASAQQAGEQMQIAADRWYQLTANPMMATTTVANTPWHDPQLYTTWTTTTSITTNLPYQDWQTWVNRNPQWYEPQQVYPTAYTYGGIQVEDEVAARRRKKNEHLRRQAQRRGVKLLMSLLDEAQIADYARTGTFLLPAPSGRLYRLRKRRTVLELDPVTMQQRNSLCVHLSYGYISEDSLIANMIAILTDEENWRKVANISGAEHTYSRGNWHSTSLSEAA